MVFWTSQTCRGVPSLNPINTKTSLRDIDTSEDECYFTPKTEEDRFLQLLSNQMKMASKTSEKQQSSINDASQKMLEDIKASNKCCDNSIIVNTDVEMNEMANPRGDRNTVR